MKFAAVRLSAWIAVGIAAAYPLHPAGAQTGERPASPAKLKPLTGKAVAFAQSPPVRQLPPAAAPAAAREPRAPREIPRQDVPKTRKTALPLAASAADPVAQKGPIQPRMPAALMTFEGVGNLDGVLPPDNNGDVGADHYVEMVNMHFCAYDKRTGTNVMSPRRMSELYAAAGFPAPASTSDDGDPIVLYDHLANRWLISQFIVSVTPCHEVVAVSQTADPTGAWNLYDFVMPNNKMNDYPHFGVWPDGYYMTDNQFNSDWSWGGAGVFVFDRAKMLAGDPSAGYQYFDLYGADPNFGGLLPADLDGPPPPAGTPNYFAMMDDSYVNPFDAVYIWEFHVDWTNAANSTFGNSGQPNYTNRVVAFDTVFGGGRNNIPQLGSSQKLDAIADRLMHRVQYRYFGAYESLVTCHTVDADGADHAGVRYYELRRALPGGLFAPREQATFVPDSNHRWMGSAAMDGQGNMAVGYSVSGTGLYPSIRYAGRLASDPSNGLFQGEATLYAGSGAQTHPAARWGDYSMLAVDPTDDCTFWYVNEYLPYTSGADWHTRIGSFRLGSSTVGTLAGVVTNARNGQGIAGAVVATTNGYATFTAADGGYAINLPTGVYTVAGSAADYYNTNPPVTVAIALNATTAQNFALWPYPLVIAPNTGLSAAGMEGGPFAPAEQDYSLTNNTEASLLWSATWTQSWVEVVPAGGELPAAAGTTVAVRLHWTADFLAPGAYSDTVVFSNAVDHRAENRPVNLAVNEFALLCEDFSGGALPPDWIVVDNIGNGAQWRCDDPAGRGNLTGGADGFAIADSDYEGLVDMDTELITPPVDCSGLQTVSLKFRTDLFCYSAEIADVDISTNGPAGPWQTLWQATDSVFGPIQISLDVTAEAAGRPNVRFRFHYYNAFWEWWWEVDDVCVSGSLPGSGDLGVAPQAGLEAAGYSGGPFAPERVYRLTNSGLAALAWTGLCAAAWFETAPPDGTLAPGGSAFVTARVSAAAASLPPGFYEASLQISNVTAGLTQPRRIRLNVLETLDVTPLAGLASAGLEGGPFAPPNRDYVLANPSAGAISWTSVWTQAWLALAPQGGYLAPGATQTVNVALLPGALVTPGSYTDTVLFSNIVSGAVHARAVTVTVIAITGDIDIFDTVSPTNDQDVPFAPLPGSTSHLERVTIVNNGGTHSRDLIVSNIYFEYIQEDFQDGLAQGWQPEAPADWTVTNGAYRADSVTDNYMSSRFAPRQWGDASARVEMRRAGDPYNAGGLALRASADFDPDGVGSGYLFLLGNDQYAVFWQNGAAYGALQGWSVSPAIKTGGAVNTLLASANGAELRFYINDTLVWTGVDDRLAQGRIAAVGYTQPLSSYATTYTFDNVLTDRPRTQIEGLGRRQRYLNAHAVAGSHPQSSAAERWSRVVPVGGLGLGSLLLDAPLPPVYGPFTLTNLPALPATLHPGDSLTFDVLYAPRYAGSNGTLVTIQNNDNDEPYAAVTVEGRGVSGWLTGRVAAAHSGAPLAGATVGAANNGDPPQTTATDDTGGYRLALLVDTYHVAASAAHYATSTVAGIALPFEGCVVTQNFALIGSLLTYAPNDVSQRVALTAAVTNMLGLTNSGPLAIDVSLRVRRPPASAAAICLPPAEGPLVHTQTWAETAASTPGSAPLGSASAAFPAAPSVRAYGFNVVADPNTLLTFLTGAPGSATVVGSTGVTGDYIVGTDFLANDFTRLYALKRYAEQLVTISTADGKVTVIGSCSPGINEAWRGLTADGAGTLYAASNDDSGKSYLYRIDSLTGAPTLIGFIGAMTIIDIAASDDGALYGLDIAADNLVRINPTNGAGTVIGAVGFDAAYAQDMDYDDANDVLYLAAYNAALYQAELRVADLVTGNTTNLGVIGDGSEIDGFALATNGAVAWAQVAPEGLEIPPGAATNVEVVFDGRAVPAAGVYQARLSLTGTFVNDPPVLPLTMVAGPEGFVLVAAVAGEHGAISPSGLVFVVNGWTNFALTAETYYHLAGVTTNGAPVADLAGVAATNWVWTNVVEDGSIAAAFAENLGPKGTPEFWLARHGVTNGALAEREMTDGDGDGMRAWEEYWTGTIPTDTLSYLRVTDMAATNDTIYLLWPSTTNTPALPYQVDQSGQPEPGAGWTRIGADLERTPPTNRWWYSGALSNLPAFFKVLVTNSW
jgi:hypothetical protein